jgi:hypothetical protein
LWSPARAPAVLPVVLAPQPCGLEPAAAIPQPARVSLPIEIEVAGAVVRVHHDTGPGVSWNAARGLELVPAQCATRSKGRFGA